LELKRVGGENENIIHIADIWLIYNTNENNTIRMKNYRIQMEYIEYK
jgi:hypothetical protein